MRDLPHPVVEESKICGYLLNRTHPDGGPKAAWFISLGFRREAWEELRTSLIDSLRCTSSLTTESTTYGIKFIISGVLSTPSGRTVGIRTIWISTHPLSMRLVTAYPEELSNDS
ncbi:DUF6883 domain-containing protein [Lacunimicrobium album]